MTTAKWTGRPAQAKIDRKKRTKQKQHESMLLLQKEKEKALQEKIDNVPDKGYPDGLCLVGIHSMTKVRSAIVPAWWKGCSNVTYMISCCRRHDCRKVIARDITVYSGI